MQMMFSNQEDNPEKSEKLMNHIKWNTILVAQILEDGFVLFEDPKSYFNLPNFLDEGVVRKIGFFYLSFDCLQKFLFGQLSDMTHNVFDFDACGGVNIGVDSRNFYRLGQDGARCRNVILRILLIKRANEPVQERMNFSDNVHVEGDVEFGQFPLDGPFIYFLHFITNFKYTAIYQNSLNRPHQGQHRAQIIGRGETWGKFGGGTRMRSGKDIKEQYKKQFESISWIRNITMNQNYHKRLGGYLSEPKLGLRKASSEHSYITAAKAKYLNNSKHINYRYNPNFHNNLNYQPSPACSYCPPDSERSRYGYASPNLQHQQQFADRRYNRQPTDMVSSEYYSPEIKTIRNTLLDIRDQMKYTNKNRNVREKEPHRGQQAAQTYEEANLRRNRAFERQLNSRLEEKNKRNRQLEIKIDQLQAAVEQLNIRNKELQDDKWRSQNKISEYEQQVQEQRARANRAENERIKVQERERALEIKIMELKADLMRREQVLRELNFNEQQQKQMQATKRLMMGKSDEVSVLVNWGKETYSRGCQTSLTEVDIQNGYRELNLMQDNLCDRINGNLKTEKQIFSRIQDIEEKMRFVHEVLYQVQEEASRLGIDVII